MSLFKEYYRADLQRYADLSRGGVFQRLKMYYSIPGVRFTYWMRLSASLKGSRLLYPLYLFARLRLRHYSYKFGIDIPYNTKIGKGFYIGHFGGIVVNGATVIGKNVNISQCVTIGMANRGPRKGCAVIGDCVYIGPGVKIVGHVKIGNNVAIGANAVVTKDIPDNAVVAGVPAKIISMDGVTGYINRTVE